MEPLDELTRQLRDTAPPKELSESLARDTAAMGCLADARWRRRRTILSGVAASILVAICMLGWLTLRSGGVAFADVVAQVGRTHSMAADKVEYEYPREKPTRKAIGVMYLKGPRVRTEFVGGDKLVNIGDRSTGEFVALNTAGRSAWRSLNASDPFDLAAWLYDIKDIAAKPLGEREFDGKRLIGFAGLFERKLRDGTTDRGGAFHAWVDPKSKLPVRIFQLDELGRERQGLENIRFDVPLDDALFDLAPPPG